MAGRGGRLLPGPAPPGPPAATKLVLPAPCRDPRRLWHLLSVLPSSLVRPKGPHTQCVQGTPTDTGVHALPERSGLTFAAEVNSGPRGAIHRGPASPSRGSSPVATPSGPSPPETCPSLLRTRRACLSPPGMALTRLWAVGRGTGPSGL